jgi:hypothetical protein
VIKIILIVASTLLLATSAFAQTGTSSPGTSGITPGQQTQSTTSTGPGASKYAPGHKMKHAMKHTKKSTARGASEYAPGHETTGSSMKRK